MKRLNTSELDVIKILGLTANGRHGVYPFERRDGQPFRVDVTMHVDTRSAGAEDDLSRTVDYSEVAADVNAVLAGPPVYLIETLAQRVAEAVLQHEAVQIVEVEVHKPDAPMNYEFNDVSMTIRRTRDDVAVGSSPERIEQKLEAQAGTRPLDHSEVEYDDLTRSPKEEVRAVIALGANMGEAWQTLARAVLALENAPGVSIVGVSALFRTAPVLEPGQAAQDDYYNAVVEVRTSLSPLGLLSVCQQIEGEFGRVRTEHWGPRTLDLDIITYEGVRSEDPQLTLPHPRAHERAFVLEPWLQVDRDATVGRHGRVDVLVEQVRDQRAQVVANFWVEQASSGAYPGAQESPAFGNRVSHDSAREEEGSERALPTWKRRKPRRIIDDASELHRIEATAPVAVGSHAPASGASSHAQVPARPRAQKRPRMESGLADDFASGLIPIVGKPARVSRRTVVRPTVTGAIPIIRPNGQGKWGEANS